MPQIIPQSPWSAAANRILAEQEKRDVVARAAAIEAEKRRQFDVNQQYDRDKLAEDVRQFGITSDQSERDIATRRLNAETMEGYRKEQAALARDKEQKAIRVLRSVFPGMDLGMLGYDDPGGATTPVPGGDTGSAGPDLAGPAPIAPRALGPLLSVNQSPRSEGPMAATSMMPGAQELTRLRSVSAGPGFPTQGPTPRPAAAAAPGGTGFPQHLSEVQRAALKAYAGMDVVPHPDDTKWEGFLKAYALAHNTTPDKLTQAQLLDANAQLGKSDDADALPQLKQVLGTDIVFDNYGRAFRLPQPSGVVPPGGITPVPRGSAVVPPAGPAGAVVPPPVAPSGAAPVGGTAAPVAGGPTMQGAPATGGAPVAGGAPAALGDAVPLGPMGTPPTAEAQRDAREAMSLLATLGNIKDMFREDWVGPDVSIPYQFREKGPEGGKLGAMADWALGPLDQPKSEFYGAVNHNANFTLKLMSGVAINPTEYARIESELPQVNQPPTVFKARLEQTRQNQIRLLQLLAQQYPELARQAYFAITQLQAQAPGARPTTPETQAPTLDELRAIQQQQRRSPPGGTGYSAPPAASAAPAGEPPEVTLQELRRLQQRGP